LHYILYDNKTTGRHKPEKTGLVRPKKNHKFGLFSGLVGCD